jgi:[acyl-carrier-protein] S-malonyltransferase
MKAFLFPGQGAQTPGMGEDCYAENRAYREMFDIIDAALPFDLKAACFKGEGLEKSEVTQPAILAHSTALLTAMGEKPDIVAGLSLGEYSAMTAAAMISPADCARLVFQRGGMMDAAVPAGKGGMLSVLGLGIDAVEQVLGDTPDVWVANHLAETQVVLAGKTEALGAVESQFVAAGAKVMPLNVSGPFHSLMLKETAEKFKELVQAAKLTEPNVIIYSNFTAKPYDQLCEVPDLLASQMCGRVRWHDITETLIQSGVTEFVEIGPGMVLSKMLKRRMEDADVNIASVRDLKSLEKYLSK